MYYYIVKSQHNTTYILTPTDGVYEWADSDDTGFRYDILPTSWKGLQFEIIAQHKDWETAKAAITPKGYAICNREQP